MLEAMYAWSNGKYCGQRNKKRCIKCSPQFVGPVFLGTQVTDVARVLIVTHVSNYRGLPAQYDLALLHLDFEYYMQVYESINLS